MTFGTVPTNDAFGARLQIALKTRGPLCVGVDAHPTLLAHWGLDASAAGAREFGLRVVDAAAGKVAVIKPQVSFFERYGSAGFAALEDVLAAGRAAGLIVIADAKRGDIGTTMDAYAEAWLTPGAPLEADAMTANAFQGLGSLTGTLSLAEASGKGVFVLAATSNPDGFDTQRAVIPGGSSEGLTVSGGIVRDVIEWNAAHAAGGGEWGSIGLVIGATVDWDAAGLPAAMDPVAPILAPGFGHQGARAADLIRYGTLSPAVIASESRSILSAGPEGIGGAILSAIATYEGAHG